MPKDITDKMDKGTVYVRAKEGARRLGISQTTWYTWSAKPGFPLPRVIGSGYSAWDWTEICGWLDGHKADTLGPPRGRAAKAAKVKAK